MHGTVSSVSLCSKLADIMRIKSYQQQFFYILFKGWYYSVGQVIYLFLLRDRHIVIVIYFLDE